MFLYFIEVGGRCPTPTPEGKATWDSPPMNWNFKMRIAGQLRELSGPCPDHIFLIPEVRAPLTQKGSVGQR